MRTKTGHPLYPQGIKRKVKGDWNCRLCRNLNFSYRVHCNLCKHKRDCLNSGFDYAVFLNLTPYEEADTCASDFDCTSLPSLSFLLAEEVFATPTRARPLNARSCVLVDLTNKCIVDGVKTSTDETKIEAVMEGVKRPVEERKGDWVCLGCKNLNFSFRRCCNRCGLNKDRYLAYN